MEPNYSKLAKVLTGFSTNLQKGERVLIDAFDIPQAMVVALVRAARELGAIPFVNLQDARISRELVNDIDVEQYETQATWELARMQKMDAYIAVRGSDNIFEMSDVDPAKVSRVMKAMKAVLDYRVNKTKWVILRWPTPAMAQQAMMSTESFEDFFFRVCTQDYSRMVQGMQSLETLMANTDQVHLKGPDTDLRFSIKGIGAVACGGSHNIPDGEVFSCPVKDSVEGEITYNAPTIYQGVSFDRIHLKFEKGKIVHADGSNAERLNEILDSDAVRAISASLRLVLIHTFSSRCVIFCLMKRSRALSTSRQVKHMKRRTTVTAHKCTGTWCRYSALSMAAVKSGLMAS